MIRINQLKMKPGHTPEELLHKVKKIMHLPDEAKLTYQIVRLSIDARQKPDVQLVYVIDVLMEKEASYLKKNKNPQIQKVEEVVYRFPEVNNGQEGLRPVIVGTGPAGLFCGYMLAMHGYRPILLERGGDVDSRTEDVKNFWEGGKLCFDSNVQFGEGGAGTFSDGKLNTLVKDKSGRSKEVLSIFHKEGAPEQILYDSKPHMGTDVLTDVVKNMRTFILAHGGEVRFYTKVTDLLMDRGSMTGVMVENTKDKTLPKETIYTNTVVLAIGHSARDTFEMLYDRQVPMSAKDFAVGLRVEHPQTWINEAQYGIKEPEHLPPAPYKLAMQSSKNRGVYTFCMCPGGYVVNASSEENRIAVNGMSYSKRDSENANSAVIVTVTKNEFGSDHPLSGLQFQRTLEEKAYAAGGGHIPVQRYGAFKAGVMGEAEHTPQTDAEPFAPCIKGAYQSGALHTVLPKEISLALIEGMEYFGKLIRGFSHPHVLLSGVESRTSSPVRIERAADGQSAIKGLYPCGEGAGYAGGIMSAAMDGMKIAECIAIEREAFSSNQKMKGKGI